MTTHIQLSAYAALALAAAAFVAPVRAQPAELAAPAALQARSPHDLDPYTVAQLPVAVVRRSAAAALPVADTIAIQELISRIYLAEDSVDRDALRDAVMPDFLLEDSIFGRSVGRDAFAELFVKTTAPHAGTRRMALNVVVSPNGDMRAIAVHYFVSIKVFSSATKSPDLQMLAQGVVRDQLVKDKGLWRLVRRISDQVSVSPSLNFNVTKRIQAARVITPNERM